MTKEKISYAELARRVGDAVLFNNHNAHNSEWYTGIYQQPLLEKKLDDLEEESKQYALDHITACTDETEKAKLQEEYETDLENGEFRAELLDFDIYQSYHITADGAEYLLNHTAEIVSYDEELDAYLWHITHFGTSWEGVHTEFYDFSDEQEHEYIDINSADKYMIY